MPKVKKILIAVDFSDCSKKSLNYAFEFFKGCDIEFHVVHVVHDPHLQGFYIPHISVDEIQKNAEEYANADLKKFIPRKFMTYEDIHLVVLKGEPYSALIDYAVKHHLELIVMGSHGASRLEKMLLGSVTDKVVRQSPIPILVVKN